MAALGADRVFATPSSMLGSVGVYGSLPTVQPGNLDGYVTTAPTKGTTGTAEEVRQSIERMKQTFVGLVMDERGANLSVDREAVARAKVYTATRGVELGFADEIGGRGAALQSAADRAGLSDYGVVTYDTDASAGSLLSAENVDTTRYFALHGLPDSAVATSLEVAGPNGTVGTANGTGPVFVGGDRP
jgi:protease-4